MRVEQRQVVASRPRAVRFSTVMQGVGVIMVFVRRTPRPLSAVRFVGGCMRKMLAAIAELPAASPFKREPAGGVWRRCVGFRC